MLFAAIRDLRSASVRCDLDEAFLLHFFYRAFPRDLDAPAVLSALLLFPPFCLHQARLRHAPGDLGAPHVLCPCSRALAVGFVSPPQLRRHAPVACHPFEFERSASGPRAGPEETQARARRFQEGCEAPWKRARCSRAPEIGSGIDADRRDTIDAGRRVAPGTLTRFSPWTLRRPSRQLGGRFTRGRCTRPERQRGRGRNLHAAPLTM